MFMNISRGFRNEPKTETETQQQTMPLTFKVFESSFRKIHAIAKELTMPAYDQDINLKYCHE
jgi:hypothetical protein